MLVVALLLSVALAATGLSEPTGGSEANGDSYSDVSPVGGTTESGSSYEKAAGGSHGNLSPMEGTSKYNEQHLSGATSSYDDLSMHGTSMVYGLSNQDGMTEFEPSRGTSRDSWDPALSPMSEPSGFTQQGGIFEGHNGPSGSGQSPGQIVTGQSPPSDLSGQSERHPSNDDNDQDHRVHGGFSKNTGISDFHGFTHESHGDSKDIHCIHEFEEDQVYACCDARAPDRHLLTAFAYMNAKPVAVDVIKISAKKKHDGKKRVEAWTSAADTDHVSLYYRDNDDVTWQACARLRKNQSGVELQIVDLKY